MHLFTAVLSVLSFATFLQFVPTYVEIFASIDKQKDFDEAAAATGTQDQEFEFIIVGGGSAGSVLANRLSEHFKVLVLEAGGDPSPFMAIPYMQGSIIGSSYDYQYTTVKQEKSCLAMVDQKMQLPFGKALGGTSNINNMMYMRGSPKDYDFWANATGDEDWSYAKVLPFFKKSEDYHGHYGLGVAHSQSGNLYVGKLGYELPSQETFFKAAAEKGLADIDLNANSSLEGFMHADVMIKNGQRWGSYQAFLQPALKRENLTIYRYAKVTKIHLDKKNRAVGVTYVRHGQTSHVKASKEILISAGPIESAKLLLLSGVGPAQDLTAIGITPVVHLPAVGRNLHDHVVTTIGPFLLNQSVSFITSRDLNAEVVSTHIHNGTGAFASTQFRLGLGYTASEEFDDQFWPDLYYIVSGRGIDAGFGSGVSKGLGGKPGVFESYFEPHIGSDAHQVRVIVARPKSSGHIKLASKDPEEMPLIDPNYFGDASDLKRLVEGIKFIINVYETSEAFKPLNARLASNPFPGCEDTEFRSTAYWECYIKHYTGTMSHHCGACSMGKDSLTSVVDSHLRVFNTTNLRVIDASVMPAVIIGNTNAPTILIGEKGADYILKTWAAANT